MPNLLKHLIVLLYLGILTLALESNSKPNENNKKNKVDKDGTKMVCAYYSMSLYECLHWRIEK